MLDFVAGQRKRRFGEQDRLEDTSEKMPWLLD